MGKSLFSADDQQRIVQAIAEAELNTSGEIRVHIEKNCKIDPVKRAIEVFHKLGMERTEQRNGVLIYLATEDHKFAIIGDQGINEHVPDHFWNDERDLMQSYFRKHEFTEGLVQGILKVGDQLKEAFPGEFGDRNELDNEISFDQGEA
jgi:uncharacterized membrane protein